LEFARCANSTLSAVGGQPWLQRHPWRGVPQKLYCKRSVHYEKTTKGGISILPPPPPRHLLSSFLLLPIVTALILCIAACSNPSGGGGSGTPPPPNAITGFTIEDLTLQEENIAIDPETKTITVTVPRGTDLTGLTPEIEVSPGAGIVPGSGEPQDFFTTDGYNPVPYTVTAADGSEAIWTVTVKWEPLDADAATIEDIIAGYLADLPLNTGTGGTADTPIILPLRLSLGGGGWAALLAAIQSAGKFMALDLSECDISGMTGTPGEFDPQPGSNDAGEGKIVSLILPDAATSIAAGPGEYSAAFKHFRALKSVSGGAVTGVGGYAFYLNCTALKTVSLPAVTSIGNEAFYKCTALETVSLPAATSIGVGAFFDCSKLETVSLPKATSIGQYAFSGCTALKTVSLPKATSIGSFAFSGCTALKTVSLPKATSISDRAFNDCTALETVSLPAVTSLGGLAFNGCTSLTAINFPASLTNIEGNPFPGCPNITITVAAANSHYKVDGGKLLTKDGTTLVGWPAAAGDITLDDITTIGNQAFWDCTALKTVSLPETTSVGSFAFWRCTSLETVSLPEATSIDNNAFQYCAALKTVSLPEATSIGNSAFYSAAGTGNLTVTLGAAPPELGTEIFRGTSAKPVTVKVPAGALAAYGPSPANTSADTWGNGFRGGGWDGAAMTGGTVNINITLTIEALP
jgi:hypothetical protein